MSYKLENPLASVVLFTSLGDTAEPADGFKSECELSIPLTSDEALDVPNLLHHTSHLASYILCLVQPDARVDRGSGERGKA